MGPGILRWDFVSVSKRIPLDRQESASWSGQLALSKRGGVVGFPAGFPIIRIISRKWTVGGFHREGSAQEIFLEGIALKMGLKVKVGRYLGEGKGGKK